VFLATGADVKVGTALAVAVAVGLTVSAGCVGAEVTSTFGVTTVVSVSSDVGDTVRVAVIASETG
jgi:hypothetical protein